MTVSEEEINKQLDLVYEKIETGEGYYGMSYEEGVKAALEWVKGDISEKPIED